MDVVSFTKVELQKRCEEWGLNVSRKASKVDLQIALQAYEEVKRLQAATKEDDPEGDLEPKRMGMEPRAVGRTPCLQEPPEGESGYLG
ncbi:hypothetical protein NDU88_004095 [Pleurodeles waltl]|uniref:Uncharacterized protein n=1 Tax=Pleurodeles waltl TaxID=8319 RepID=A0AAV7LIW0_PLEWA|nr:hypothetical protein NDU88_004095 [Pleurodeles waltl]